MYERYGLPAGDYEVGIEVPKGMRIYFPMMAGIRREAKVGIVHLDTESGVSVCYVLMSNTKITGRVLDPNGNSMDGVCVDIQPVSSTGARNSRVFDCTKSGKFELEMMPPGQYYVVANRDGRVTAREPFPTLYYPGTTDLRQAVPVTVPEGGSVENIDFRVPSIRKSVELSGRVVFSDGMPAPEAFVKFVGRAESYHEDVVAQPDGSFRMSILDETEGELHAEIMVGLDEALACPQFRAAIRPGGFGTFLKSVPVVISEQSGSSAIKLDMQVASCKSWHRHR